MANCWLKTAVFYEIYPNSFADSNGDGYGDLKGITQKLDYIKSLGANAIWLNPHYDSPFKDGGYDVRDYKKVSPRFGSEEDFDEFIAAAHAKGIKVILDLVPGHTSEEHVDFIKSTSSTPNDMYDRFIWTDNPWSCPEGIKIINGRYDRYGSYCVNFFSTQPALNYGFNRIDEPSWQSSYKSEAALKTREWLKDVMRFWLERGADGFRVDMADSLVKNDGDQSEKPATSEVWQDIRAMLDEEYPDAVLVSEWANPQAIRAGFHADFMLDHWGNPYNLLVRAEEDDRKEIYSYFNQNGKGDAAAFAEGFTKWYEQTKNNGYIAMISCNHDTPRLGGNLKEKCHYTQEQLKVIYATLFTMPCVPFIYYGDEIGMHYQKDIPSVECGFQRTGSRTPMQWNFGKNAGFTDSDTPFLPTFADKTTNVESQEKDKKSLLNCLRGFLEFRKSHSEFTSNELEFVHAKGSEPLVYKRGKLMIVVNPLDAKQTVPVTIDKNDKAIFSIGKAAKVKKDGIECNPLSFTVFECK